MNFDILMLFDKKPDALYLYEAAEAFILELFPDVKIKVSKTQVSFSNRYGFAFLWPPNRRIKNKPGTYIVLTFGLGRQEVHPRILESVEPYPGRWTHHVLISSPDELDEQIKNWLIEAYNFSMMKGRRR